LLTLTLRLSAGTGPQNFAEFLVDATVSFPSSLALVLAQSRKADTVLSLM
jgi:hypothetical protein